MTTHDQFQPVATTLEFRKRRRTFIDPASFRPARLDDYDVLMDGSVEVTLPHGSYRVPVRRYDDDSLETAEVVLAQPIFTRASYLGTLILTPNCP